MSASNYLRTAVPTADIPPAGLALLTRPQVARPALCQPSLLPSAFMCRSFNACPACTTVKMCSAVGKCLSED